MDTNTSTVHPAVGLHSGSQSDSHARSDLRVPSDLDDRPHFNVRSELHDRTVSDDRPHFDDRPGCDFRSDLHDRPHSHGQPAFFDRPDSDARPDVIDRLTASIRSHSHDRPTSINRPHSDRPSSNDRSPPIHHQLGNRFCSRIASCCDPLNLCLQCQAESFLFNGQSIHSLHLHF
jgi:hypothetical protein